MRRTGCRRRLVSCRGSKAGSEREKGSVSALTCLFPGGGGQTHEFPPTLGDGFEAVDRFHVDGVDDAGFGNPDRAEEVRPLARRRLLEGSVRVGAQDAGLRLVGRVNGRAGGRASVREGGREGGQWGWRGIGKHVRERNARRVYRERRYTCDRAIAPLGYKELRSNLVACEQCTGISARGSRPWKKETRQERVSPW